MLAHLIFLILTATTPHCHADQPTNCHYSDSVSVNMGTSTVFAEVHHGKYVVTFYGN